MEQFSTETAYQILIEIDLNINVTGANTAIKKSKINRKHRGGLVQTLFLHHDGTNWSKITQAWRSSDNLFFQIRFVYLRQSESFVSRFPQYHWRSNNKRGWQMTFSDLAEARVENGHHCKNANKISKINHGCKQDTGMNIYGILNVKIIQLKQDGGFYKGFNWWKCPKITPRKK